MSWEDWIIRQTEDKPYTSYDFLCELCVSSYGLNKKSRKADLKDKCHFFIHWWYKNRNNMNTYTTTVKLGQLLNVDHSTILHYAHRRKPTIFFEENTICINDFLNS